MRIYISGTIELALGVGFIVPSTSKVTGLGSATFLVCVNPANVYMWIYDVDLGDGISLTTKTRIIRFLLQIFLVFFSVSGYGNLDQPILKCFLRAHTGNPTERRGRQV